MGLQVVSAAKRGGPRRKFEWPDYRRGRAEPQYYKWTICVDRVLFVKKNVEDHASGKDADDDGESRLVGEPGQEKCKTRRCGGTGQRLIRDFCGDCRLRAGQ